MNKACNTVVEKTLQNRIEKPMPRGFFSGTVCEILLAAGLWVIV